jgi:hypothetical protein
MSVATLMFKFVLSHVSTTFRKHFDDSRGSWVPREQVPDIQFADGLPSSEDEDRFGYTGIGAENAVGGFGTRKITMINMKHFDAR